MRVKTAVLIATFFATTLSGTPQSLATVPARINAKQVGAFSAAALTMLGSSNKTRVVAPLPRGLPTRKTPTAGLGFRATPTCVRCNTGPALAAAVSYLTTLNPGYRALAIKTFDSLLITQRWPNGALAPRAKGGDIDTMFFADNLGIAFLLLHKSLDRQHRASWSTAVTGAADYLIHNKNLAWYTNGNIVIGNALTMALAYRVSGNRTYLTAYKIALTFAFSPNQKRWPGYGFKITKKPRNADGRDGSGYFAEAGKKPGYDPDYTMLQSEQLSRLFLVTGDPSIKRALNMVTNQLLGRVNKTKWTLNASGGSRHSPPSPEPFDSSALMVLAYKGGRNDLSRYVAPQFVAVATHFRVDLANPPMGDRGYYAIGLISATLFMATSGSAVESSFASFAAHR